MLKVENVDIYGWEAAIRGCRNPMSSHHKSDTWFYDYSGVDDTAHCHSFAVKNAYMYDSDQEGYSDVHWIEHQNGPEGTKEIKHVETIKDHPYEWKYGCKAFIGPNDYKLMQNLCKGGSEETKWRRFVHVTCDITAPLYFYKQLDAYRIGVEKNSCSTMHKIHAKEFTRDDFSCDKLISADEYFDELPNGLIVGDFDKALEVTIMALNDARELYLQTKDKKFWYQMIQLLPSSYNQRRTYEFNYESLANIYRQRKNHKLDCWRDFCKWTNSLPYSQFITLSEGDINGMA